MPILSTLDLAARSLLALRGFSSRWHGTPHGNVHAIEGRGGGPLGRAVFVHGLASSAGSFAQSMIALQPHFGELSALDLPGHGRSPVPKRRLSPALVAESLDAALFEQTEEPAVLVGNSLGGAVALRFALSYPDRVRGVVVSSPAGARLPERDFRTLLDHFRLRNHADGQRFFERLHHRPLPLQSLLAWDLVRLLQRPHLRELVTALDEAEHVALEVAELRPPALVLWGESDRVMPRSALAYFEAALPPTTRIQRLPRVGHSPHVEAPTRFADAVAAFARELAPRAPRARAERGAREPSG